MRKPADPRTTGTQARSIGEPGGHDGGVTQMQTVARSKPSLRKRVRKAIIAGNGAHGGQRRPETQHGDAAVRATIDQIIELGRENAFAIRQRMRVRQSTLAHIARAYFGYHTHLAEDERKRCMNAAGALLKKLADGESHEAAWLVSATDLAAAPWEEIERDTERRLIKLARRLPAYDWVQSVRGFGDLSFARIIAETGDLSQYSNPGKVWKRMGLAVFDGKAQRKARDAEKAKEFGYNPYRRAVAFVAFEPVLKAQSVRKNGGQEQGEIQMADVAEPVGAGQPANETQSDVAGPYRLLYDQKKQEYLARGEAGEKEWTKARAHKAAMRFASKRLLRNLWTEWNRSRPD